MKNHTSLFASIMFVGGVLGATAFAASSGINIDQVKERTEAQGAHFKVKENWLTKLPKEQRKRVLGLNYLPNKTLKHATVRPRTPLPTALDWRNVNGIDWIGPVLDQGQCGSCVAFATVGTLEAQYSISNNQPWLHPSFSPQMLFNCGGASCDFGWDPSSAASYLQRSGVADEACMPYTSGLTGKDVACSAKCSDSSSRSIKIAGSTSGGSSIEAVKAALQNGPLVTTLSVYADFEGYTSGVYKHVDDGNGPEGGHAVSIIGYDDSKNAWLIRNSWNTSWGENGFAWIDYDDTSGVGGETWHLNITPSKSLLSVQVPGDKQVASGVVSADVNAAGVNASNVNFMVGDGSAKNVTANKTVATCSSNSTSTCSTALDTHSLSDGAHTVYAVSADGKTKSQVRAFYVLNSEPNLSLKMTPKTGTDWTKPLSGTVYLEGVLATGSGVPMDQVTRHIYDSNGNDIQNEYRLYTTLSNNMEFGWTTTVVPNGTYTVVYSGQLTYLGKVYKTADVTYKVTVTN